MDNFIKPSIIFVTVAICIYFVPVLLKKKTIPKGQGGFAAPGWKKVADTFRKHVDSGWQQGGAISVFYEGELVVEFAAGSADDDAYWGWTRDTLSQFFSSTKGVAAVVMAMLVDRGLLEYSKPVSHYWPEFGQNGKEDITVEQLLSHQGAVAYTDEKYSAFDMLDNIEHLEQALAKQSPNWTPGEGHGYHGFTLGLYEDQLVRRVDPEKRSLSQFFHEEVSQKFGIDFFIGLPKEEHYRCARNYEMKIFSLDLIKGRKYWPSICNYLFKPNSLIAKELANPKELDMDGITNNPEYREIPNPSTQGFGTAIGLAMFYGIIANGGVHEGRRMLSEKAIEQLQESIVSGYDKILSMNITYGRGVTLRQTSKGNYLFGAPGSGGQMGYCDPVHKLGWAYVTNHMSLYAIGDDPKYLEIEAAIYESLSEVISKKKGHSSQTRL